MRNYVSKALLVFKENKMSEQWNSHYILYLKVLSQLLKQVL